jgi:hypothetical protein
MNVPDDDRTVATLQRLARAEAPADGWLPDEVSVLRRGRHLRTRRRGAAAGAGALVLALAIGVPATIGAHHTAPPAAPTSTATVHQEPRTFGDATVAALELDPAVQAVNLPSSAGPDALTADGVAGLDVTIAATGDGVTVTADGGGRGAGTASDIEVRWSSADSTAQEPYVETAPVLASGPDGIEMLVLTGVLPSWQRDPVALLVNRNGWTAGDGTVRHVAELPTFRAPTDDGRLLYLVASSGEPAQRLIGSGSPLVVFVAADGEVFVPGCQGLTTAACEASLGVPLAEWLDEPVARFAAPDEAASPTSEPADGATSQPATGDGTPTSPSTTGEPTPVQLAPGVRAAVGPISGAGGLVTVGRFDDVLVRITRDGTDAKAGLQVINAEGGMGGEPVTTGVLGPWATVLYSAGTDSPGGTQERWYVLGTTPPDLAGAAVFVYSPTRFAQEGGGTTSVLHVPTFTMPPVDDNPIEAGRPWFLVGFDGDAIASVRGTDAGSPFAGRVVFAGPDGTIEDPACDEKECPDAGSQAAYAAIRELVGKAVGTRAGG